MSEQTMQTQIKQAVLSEYDTLFAISQHLQAHHDT